MNNNNVRIKDDYIANINSENETDNEPNIAVLKEFNQNEKSGLNNFFRMPLQQQYTMLDYRVTIEQLVVYNPTTLVIHAGINSDCDNTRYDLLINANKLCVFPPMNVLRYSFYIVAFTANPVMPFVIAYTKYNQVAGVYSI